MKAISEEELEKLKKKTTETISTINADILISEDTLPV